MRKLLCLIVISLSLACAAQDSVMYKGMKMTVQESDTLKDMLDNNKFPPVISFISNGCCVTKTDDDLCPGIVCIPDETTVYVCRKSGDKYLCLCYGHSVFINKQDIKTDYDVDLLLNNPSNIYKKYRLSKAEFGDLCDMINKIESLKSFYAKKPIIVMNDETIDDDLGMKGLSIKILNNSSKTIKNIWVTFTGYTEKDKPVKDVSKKILVTRSIDRPIRKGYSSEFNFNYIWDTDLLFYSMINSIKVQYMDNSVKLLNNAWRYCMSGKLRAIDDTIVELKDFMENY